jgi:hypothetical protein
VFIDPFGDMGSFASRGITWDEFVALMPDTHRAPEARFETAELPDGRPLVVLPAAP